MVENELRSNLDQEELFKYSFELAKQLGEPYFDKEKDWPNVSRLAEYITGTSNCWSEGRQTPFYHKLKDIYSLRWKLREGKLAEYVTGVKRICQSGTPEVPNSKSFSEKDFTSTPFYQKLYKIYSLRWKERKEVGGVRYWCQTNRRGDGNQHLPKSTASTLADINISWNESSKAQVFDFLSIVDKRSVLFPLVELIPQAIHLDYLM